MEGKRKRRKFFYHSHKVKQKSVDSGACGLFFTCNGNEKQAVREAYNVLEQALEKWQEKKSLKSDFDDNRAQVNASFDGNIEEDAADDIKRFCDQARSIKNNAENQVIRQRPTGANHCLFFIVKDIISENVYDFVDFFIEMVLEKKCCRLLQRVWPVEKTCRVNMVEVDMELSQLISRHFHPNEDGKWPTYSFEFKARNNNSLLKSDAMDMALLALKQLVPNCHVSLSDPNITILVQVVHQCVMLSCIRSFVQRRKLSLHNQKKENTAEISIAQKIST
ncbi:unnamed protein product [Thelazia callipaeda]|uniref:THUMP domain-containing protein n=1 Tax=Thelazia callipaeda TaxID=103827 RepID=A0A0N5D4D0_THECL|nr:unnamed protein product [Thelazia callipaeda]